MSSDDSYTFWQRNGLSMVLLGLLSVSLIAQFLTGRDVYNQERNELGASAVSYSEYLVSGHFVSAIFENWESEFFQMGLYVLLTVNLRQKGSAESRPMDQSQEHERIDNGSKPWAVTKGGVWKILYGHSLALAFGVLFLISFTLHLEGSWRHELVQRALRSESPITLRAYFGQSQFWFESFQNWQSEFLAVLALVVLSIWLRQQNSPQSKPLEAPHEQTGT